MVGAALRGMGKVLGKHLRKRYDKVMEDKLVSRSPFSKRLARIEKTKEKREKYGKHQD